MYPLTHPSHPLIVVSHCHLAGAAIFSLTPRPWNRFSKSAVGVIAADGDKPWKGRQMLIPSSCLAQKGLCELAKIFPWEDLGDLGEWEHLGEQSLRCRFPRVARHWLPTIFKAAQLSAPRESHDSANSLFPSGHCFWCGSGPISPWASKFFGTGQEPAPPPLYHGVGKKKEAQSKARKVVGLVKNDALWYNLERYAFSSTVTPSY